MLAIVGKRKTLPTSRKSFLNIFNNTFQKVSLTYLSSIFEVECGTLHLQVAKISSGQFPPSFWISVIHISELQSKSIN